jgi:hypothetical protein
MSAASIIFCNRSPTPAAAVLRRLYGSATVDAESCRSYLDSQPQVAGVLDGISMITTKSLCAMTLGSRHV